MQINVAEVKFSRSESGEWVASAGSYHTGYGRTKADAVDALLWSMENE